MNLTLLMIILVIEIIIGASLTVYFMFKVKNNGLKALILYGGQILTVLLVGLTLRWIL